MATSTKKKNVLRYQWPRVLWIRKRGVLRLCVDSRKTGFPAGKREFWNTPAEALAVAEQIARQKDNEGAQSFAEVAPSQRRDAAEALAVLENSGGSLLDAARLFVREKERLAKLAHVPTVDVAIDGYLDAKRAEEARGEICRLTLYEIEAKMRIVRAEFGNLNVTELDEARIQKFLRDLPHRAQGKANIRTKLSQFLNYCRREGKWITSNPTDNIKVKVNKSDVLILSVEDVKRLLGAALNCQSPESVVPYIAVQLFGGLRPFEASRLDWERIHFETEQIEVLGETSKTRETRFVQMEPQLIEWLLPLRKARGAIIGPEFVDTLRAVKLAAGFTFGEDDSNPWVKDILRHCYGSYWLALHKDRARLAELMGTSLDMIKSHYKRAIPDGVAKEFWKLSPVAKKPGRIIPITAAA
jgi:site-specific recombinase XerC